MKSSNKISDNETCKRCIYASFFTPTFMDRLATLLCYAMKVRSPKSSLVTPQFNQHDRSCCIFRLKALFLAQFANRNTMKQQRSVNSTVDIFKTAGAGPNRQCSAIQLHQQLQYRPNWSRNQQQHELSVTAFKMHELSPEVIRTKYQAVCNGNTQE